MPINDTTKYLVDVVATDVLESILELTIKYVAKIANTSLLCTVSTLHNTCLSQMSTSKIVVRCLKISHPLKSRVLYIWARLFKTSDVVS